MQHFIDPTTQKPFGFDDGVDVAATHPDLVSTGTVRPSKHHDWVDGAWSLVRAAELLAEAQAARWDEVKQLRVSVMLGGVVFNGDTFQSRGIDMNNAQAAIISLTSWPKDHPALDNTIVSLTKSNAKTILTSIIGLYYDADVNAQSLRGLINLADNEAAIAAIDIDVGWPTVPYTGV